MSPQLTNPHHMVVGIDGSTAALAALDWAADEAARYHWPLRLVHALGEYVPQEMMVAERERREAAEAVFTEARQRLETRGRTDLEVSTVALPGSAHRVLLRPDLGAHTLVVGRRGSGGFAELLLGSTAQAVAARARVPVVVVPDKWQSASPAGVTLGVDGSPRSHAAIEYAFVTASRWQVPLVAVFALRRPGSTMAGAAPVDAEGQSQAIHLLAEQLAPWRAKFPDVTVTEVVADGHPVTVIREHAADAGLVVVGGRGHGTITGLLLGSVTRALLAHVDRPVAVVHDSTAEPDEPAMS
jgi:nucleotide-binding universal stress UspA family protein